MIPLAARSASVPESIEVRHLNASISRPDEQGLLLTVAAELFRPGSER